jgi:hypothetical protein
MKAVIERTNRLLGLPLKAGPRGMLALGALLLLATYALPFWKVTTFGPEGLRIGTYSYELAQPEALASEADPEAEVAGSRELPADFAEFRWLAFALGVLGLLLLRAVVLGTMSMLVDVSVMFAYVTIFSFWSIGSRFSRYGESSPAAGAYVLALVAVILVGALLLAWRQATAEIAGDARLAG